MKLSIIQLSLLLLWIPTLSFCEPTILAKYIITDARHNGEDATKEYLDQGDHTAYTKVDLNLRTYGSTRSSIIGVIPQGDKVVIQYCDSYWCKVQYQNRYNGFVSKQYLNRRQTITKNYIPKTPLDRSVILPQRKQQRYYTNSFGETVPSPTHYPVPPSGASAVCRDGTYSFSRNRRGTCSHHGGVKRWLSTSTTKISKSNTYYSNSSLNYTPPVKTITKTTYHSNAYRSSTAVRCNGITQKGYQCKRRTKNSNGYCWQH